MNLEILEEIGLSPNESKIYEALVEHGELSISDIALAAKIHRRNAYDAVQRLLDKGLCFQIATRSKDIYQAVDPDKIFELLAEKQQRLNALLPLLKKKYKEHTYPEASYIYRGYEGQKNIWREILKAGEDSYAVGAKGAWFDKRLMVPRIEFFKKAKKQKIKFFQLFDHEVKTTPYIIKDFPAQLQYRFLSKEYSSNSVLHFFGDYVINYTGVSLQRTDENTIFFIIKSKNLADTYRKWFWSMWKLGAK